MSLEVQVASFLYYISVEGRHMKATNVFHISSVSAIIKEFLMLSQPLGPGLIQLPTTEKKMKEFSQ